MSRPLGLLVCGGRRRGGAMVSRLSLGVDEGTVTEVESIAGETNLGEMLGLFLAALSTPLP